MYDRNYAEELKAQLYFKYHPDKVVFCLNSLRSALILYYQACRTSQPQDWFDACLAFKKFQHAFQTMSLWQQIKFCIRSLEIDESMIAKSQK